ncbi:DivIVA domain-containing protein [Oscillospiraceae bacterium PP1C4]
MLNPNDIANKKFDKSLGGYKTEEVERFLEQVANDLNELLADKRELEQKLIVLADKLEEYKHDEESLRSALLGAQKLGDSVVRDAKAKAEEIIDNANAKGNMIIDHAKRAIEREKSSFIRMQREVATFKSKLQLVYKQHLELISSIPVEESIFNATAKPAPAADTEDTASFEGQIPPIEEKTIDTAAGIGDEFSQVPPAELPLNYSEHNLEYVREEEYTMETEQPPKRDSRFGPLKFGKEFDIKRDDDKRKK